MKLLVGLGNPGPKYLHTRHNTGFMFLDYLGKQQKLDKQIKTLKPQTFMNQSGIAVAKELSFYKLKPANLTVIHDDLDLKLGEYKIQFGKGPKLHNGIESIEQVIGSKDFWRVRIGVDNRDPNNRISGESYVLQNFAAHEIAKLQTQVFPKVAAELKQVLASS